MPGVLRINRNGRKSCYLNPKANLPFSTSSFSLVFIIFVLILLAYWIWIIYPTAVWPYTLHGYHMLPEANHTKPVTTKNVFNIWIGHQDRIFLPSCGEIENMSDLSMLVQEEIENLELKPVEVSILMRIYGTAKWSTVVSVLKELRKAKINSVVLMTQGEAFLPEYLYHEARGK